MITSPRPSTSTTGPCGPFSASSRLSVPAADIWSSSAESVERRVPGRVAIAVSLIVVFQFAAITVLRVHVEDHAGVDGAGVDVHAHAALVPFGEVADAVDGLGLVDGIQRTAGDGQLVVQMLHLDLRREIGRAHV